MSLGITVPHTTKTVQQYMDTWRRKTPRGQLGFPKTCDELRELKEFAERQVRCDQWKKRWLWKTRVEERLQFTRSDEALDERAGVGAARAAKRLERERETPSRGYTTATIFRLLFSTGKVFVLRLATPWVCVFPVFPMKKKNEPHLVLQT